CNREPTIRSGPRNKSRVSPGAYAPGMRSDYGFGTPSKLPCELSSRRASDGLIKLGSESPQRVRSINHLKIGSALRADSGSCSTAWLAPVGSISNLDQTNHKVGYLIFADAAGHEMSVWPQQVLSPHGGVTSRGRSGATRSPIVPPYGYCLLALLLSGSALGYLP